MTPAMPIHDAIALLQVHLLDEEFGLSKFSPASETPQTLHLPETIEDATLKKAWREVCHLYVFEHQSPDGFKVYQPLGSPAADKILEENTKMLKYLWNLGKEE